MKYHTFILLAGLLLFSCKEVVLTEINNSSTKTFPIEAETFGWEKVNLKTSTSCFAFDSQSNLYFLHNNKLYRTNNNFIVEDSLEIPLQSETLSLSPVKIYINGNDFFFLIMSNGFNNNLFISEDKGKTWLSPNGFSKTQVADISSKGNHVYISSSSYDESTGMVQISEDNGINWRTIIKDGTSNYYFCKENSSGKIFFWGNNILYVSNNYGFDYSGVEVSDTKYSWNYSLAFGFNNDLILGNGSGIYITNNNGLSFQSIHENNEITEYYTVFEAPNGYIYAMRRSEINSQDCELRSVYVSKDGGYTWYSFLNQPDGYYYGSHQLGKDGYLYISCKIKGESCIYRSTEKLF